MSTQHPRFAPDPTRKKELPKWEQKRRLTRALRLAIERLVANDVPEDDLRRAADAAERFAESLEPYPRLRYAIGFGETSYAGDVSAFFDQSPLVGLANPMAPPIEMAAHGERGVRGHVRFGAQYEGVPGHVHGGYVAATFDELLGLVQARSGAPGMTGTLTVRFRRPTPLYTDLTLDAQWLRSEGRKIFTRGTIHAGDTLTAEAEGLFISIGNERRREFAELRARRVGGETVEPERWGSDGS